MKDANLGFVYLAFSTLFLLIAQVAENIEKLALSLNFVLPHSGISDFGQVMGWIWFVCAILNIAYWMFEKKEK